MNRVKLDMDLFFMEKHKTHSAAMTDVTLRDGPIVIASGKKT